jgi:hypothetical protein
MSFDNGHRVFGDREARWVWIGVCGLIAAGIVLLVPW